MTTTPIPCHPVWAFPLQHVDDHAGKIPPAWLQHGGVMMPMFQSEAMWLNFDSTYLDDHEQSYPFAIKIATGKQCAVSGEAWSEGLQHRSAELRDRTEINPGWTDMWWKKE